MGERGAPGLCPGDPAEWELAVDPADRYANGGEEPWEADAPMVPKWRRRGAGRVRAVVDGWGDLDKPWRYES